jgi:hypothetical protein
MCEIDRPLRLGSTDKLARGNGPVADSALSHCKGSQVCDWAKGWATKEQDFGPRQRKNLNLLIAFRQSVEPTQPYTQRAERVKRPKPEIDPSHI